jgi:hypothetical protein
MHSLFKGADLVPMIIPTYAFRVDQACQLVAAVQHVLVPVQISSTIIPTAAAAAPHEHLLLSLLQRILVNCSSD